MHYASGHMTLYGKYYTFAWAAALLAASEYNYLQTHKI